MPSLSVVVPIYNVEEYLRPCLDSIAAQSFSDLEVILVDDGATDSSPAIAEDYAARDPRFKVVHRPNGGLSAARNTGIEHARGDYLAFVDSDDVLPADAYERLVGSLEQTGSDFATGNVLRLVGADDTRPARFLRATFAETRLKTHVTKFRPLLADRIAWNKVFRRSFWDAQGLTFPEGRINEDIPVMLPLHFSAKAVDVIAEPVYLWRFRQTGALSITEQRTQKHALLNRLWAVTDVHDFLSEHGHRKARRWYDEVLVADDLKYYLNVLDRADDEYRELFLDRVNALLDRADDRIYDKLTAIERLKWHLVRRRLMPELLEVLRFERSELAQAVPVREGRHWYGDYPFRNDARLAIPSHVYRLGPELTFTARIESLERDGDRLRITGLAFVDGIGAPAKGSQRVWVSALAPGPLRRARLLLTPLRFRTSIVHRPDANADGRNRVSDASWSGFEATLDARRLRRRGRWRDGVWDVYVSARAAGVTRRRVRFFLGDRLRPRAVELPAARGVQVRALPTLERQVRLEVRTRWASLAGFRAADGGLAIDGEIHPPPAGALKLELRGGEGAARLRRPVTVDGGRFSATVPFDAVLGAVRERKRLDEDDEDEPREETDEADAALAEDDEDELRPEWELFLIGDGPPLRLALRAEAGDGAWPCGDRELALLRTPQGDATLTLAQPHAVLTAASWTADGRLRLAGETPPSDRPREFLLASRARGVVETLPLGAAATGGPFELLLEPGRIASLAGELPLPEGRWRLWTRVVGATDPDALAPVKLPAALDGRLPLDATVAGKPMYLIRHADGDAVLVVRPDLATEERGPYNQRRLQRTVYPARRAEPLTDTVVYSSFTGRQYSDNPRAIHEELVRRGAPLEHRWLVRDAAAVVPPTASVLRQGSEEAHAVMARARYVVFNDHFPAWFSRRPDQVCLQTWHGTPLKRLGFDVPRRRGGVLRHEDRWAEQEGNWQYVVSPNRFSTPILRDAYALTGELLETGYPRDDVLAAADRADRSRRLRERLGIPDGVRTVLYAPTFRDHVRDRRGRYRLDLQLDLARLREAVGPDTMILFRKHHYVFDTVPLAADGFVRDVSEYPDSTELLLAADVLLTDYSSIAVDYANTGRPMLFFTYDLETYQNEIRGFYLDYEATVPGPLLRTTDEVAEALRELDAVHAAQATRYDAFVQRFCELDDGAAAARVVDRVFAGVAEPAAGTGPAVSPGRA